VRAVVNYIVCKLAVALQLILIASLCRINPITNPNAVNNYLPLDNILNIRRIPTTLITEIHEYVINYNECHG
jgi:hypothetical protein